jgi:glycerophosphoryl diester phosphodiesterase
MPRALVLAHRGARTTAPENTLEAFGLALAQGADGVELDVHRTADGQLVVHHDADASGLGVLAERTEAQVRAARPDIPTLDEVLDACAGSLVNIEIKNLPGDHDYDPDDHAAELVVACIQRRVEDGRTDDVVVSSFNLATIDRVRALDPSVPTGFLTMVGFDPFDALDVCVARGHGALHPFVHALVGPLADATALRAHELGITVTAWTVNDEQEMARLSEAGVDILITDVPETAVRVLGPRDPD